ncbi:MAG: hypothetical protein R3C49_28135 [Planctomycetaceae bacterium]
MFGAKIELIEQDQVSRYALMRDGENLSYSDVLDLWQSDRGFRSFCTKLLADSPFKAYRWETPALTTENCGQPFQFVLLNCPRFASRRTDPVTYADYFTTDQSAEGIVVFSNLSGDATLIVPSPRTDVDAYGHLAAFVRSAPDSQTDAFWTIVGRTVRSAMNHQPLWLSTAGGGVAWLHVRMDARPKYYGYSPFKTTKLPV